MIKIFVSSTFIDMHFERDAIQLKILPELQKEAEAAGERLDFCDLRWGINTQDIAEREQMNKILQVCFREINNCSNCEFNPFMVVILGERYGSEPEPDKMEEVVRRMNECRGEEVYKRADVEGKSYTNLEILYAPLFDDAMFKRTFFFFRAPIENAPERYRGNAYDKKKLDALKEKIRRKNEELGLDNIVEYALRWEGDGETGSLAGIEAFTAALQDKLYLLLRSDFAKLGMLSDEERAARRHWLFVRQKAELFSGMQESLDILHKKAEEGVRELFVHGPAGSGKSCLFSKFVSDKKKQGWNVYPYICGGVNDRTKRSDIYIEWIAYLESLLHLQSDNIAQSKNTKDENEKNRRTYKYLAFLFKKYNESDDLPPLLLAVDGSDKIDKGGEHVYSASVWGYNDFRKIQFIYTYTQDKPIRVDTDIEYHLFINNDGKNAESILEGHLSYIHKDLPAEIKRYVIEKCRDKNPYYMQLLFKRLSLLNARDFAEGTDNANQLKIYKRTVDAIPETVPEFTLQLIELLADRMDRDMVRSVVHYLAASECGLRRSDLQGILIGHGYAWDNADFSLFMNFFTEVFAEGTDGVWDFIYAEVKEKIQNGIDLPVLRRDIFHYLQRLPKDDPFRASQILAYCYRTDEKAYFVKVLQEEYQYNETFVKSFNAGEYVKTAEWFISILKEADLYGVDERTVYFVNYQLRKYPIHNAHSLMMEIDRAIVEYCSSHVNVAPSQKARAWVHLLLYRHERGEDVIPEYERALVEFKNVNRLDFEGIALVNTIYLNLISRLTIGRQYEKAEAYLAELYGFLQDSFANNRIWHGCGDGAAYIFHFLDSRITLDIKKEEAAGGYGLSDETYKKDLRFLKEGMELLLQTVHPSYLQGKSECLHTALGRLRSLFDADFSTEAEMQYYAEKYLPFVRSVAEELDDITIFRSLADCYFAYAAALVGYGKNAEANGYAEKGLQIKSRVEANGLHPQIGMQELVEAYTKAAKMFFASGDYALTVEKCLQGLALLEKYGKLFAQELGYFDISQAYTVLYALLSKAYAGKGDAAQALETAQREKEQIVLYFARERGYDEKPDIVYRALSELLQRLPDLWKKAGENVKIEEKAKDIFDFCQSPNVKEGVCCRAVLCFLDKAAEACGVRKDAEAEVRLREYHVGKIKELLKERKDDAYALRKDAFFAALALGEAYAKIRDYENAYKTMIPYYREIKKTIRWGEWDERFTAIKSMDILATAEECLGKRSAKKHRRQEFQLLESKVYHRKRRSLLSDSYESALRDVEGVQSEIEIDMQSGFQDNEYAQKAIYRKYAEGFVRLGRCHELNGEADKALECFAAAVGYCEEAEKALGEEVDIWLSGLCYNLLGQCAERAGQENAFTYYEKALERWNRPDNSLLFVRDNLLTVLCSRISSAFAPQSYTQEIRKAEQKTAKRYAEELFQKTGWKRYTVL